MSQGDRLGHALIYDNKWIELNQNQKSGLVYKTELNEQYLNLFEPVLIKSELVQFYLKLILKFASQNLNTLSSSILLTPLTIHPPRR